MGRQGMASQLYLESISDAIRNISADQIKRALDLLVETQAAGGRVYIIGNGGSAATATHMACDLTKAAHVPGRGTLCAFALTDNLSLVTAWANDVAYEQVFSEQLNVLAQPGDLVIAISVSGNSPNVLAGLVAATRAGASTVGLFGLRGRPAARLVDVAIHVGSDDYGLVETAHLAIAHLLTRDLRRRLTASNKGPEVDDGWRVPDGKVGS